MAQIIIDITPAAAVTRAVDAVCSNNGYQATIDGQPNPETKNQFAKRMLAAWVRSQVVRYESEIATKEARETATASAELLSIT